MTTVNNNVNDHYRDMAVQAASNRAGSTSEAALGMQDFLRLLVAQLQNQDMMNPMDNTEFISQMATFSTLTAINNMAEQTMTSYAVSLLGKEVVAAEIDSVTGRMERFEGEVTAVSLFDRDGPRIFIGDKSLSLQSIMSVGRLPESQIGEPAISTANLPNGKIGEEYSAKLAASGTGDSELKWGIEAGELPDGLTLSEDGIISGTPLAEGIFSATFKVTYGDERSLTRWLVIQILQAAYGDDDDDPVIDDDGGDKVDPIDGSDPDSGNDPDDGGGG